MLKHLTCRICVAMMPPMTTTAHPISASKALAAKRAELIRKGWPKR